MTPNDDRLAAFEARFDARLAELEERDRKRETDVLSALTQLKSMSENAATEEHRRDEDYTLLTQSLDQRLTEFAMEPGMMSREEFEAFLRNETGKWAKVAKAAGVRADD